tara:strand:+ start:2797 stop:3222 length:426 start_codon:yes stop_codon:yes gene_type:complete
MPLIGAKDSSLWAVNHNFNSWGESVNDNTSTKIGPGGSNGVSLVKVTTFSSGERIQSCALIAWATEVPATIDILVQSHTDGMANQPSHEYTANQGAYNAAPPGGTALTDGKINIWAAYPQGLYLVVRTGFATNYVSIFHFM